MLKLRREGSYPPFMSRVNPPRYRKKAGSRKKAGRRTL